MRVAVIGAGYVGLVTGACLAEQGHEVLCVDRERAKVDAINRGTSPFHEPGLDEVLGRAVGTRLRATTDLAGAVGRSDISLICVGTPFDGTRIDLSMVEAAVEAIGAALAGGSAWHTVVVRSTVVPGTTDGVVLKTLERASGRRVGETLGLGMNPEFLTEGQALADFRQQDRVVLGAVDARSLAAMEALYAEFPEVPRVVTNPRTAEMIKYASNALLATAISFSNELADLCESLGGVDIAEVMHGAHLSRYLTAQGPVERGWTAPLAAFLEAGCGYGGSCLPKDVKALTAHGQARGLPMSLLAAVSAINAGRAERLLSHVRSAIPTLRGRAVTVLGLAFKPGTDDVRETPARSVIETLLAEGARVTVHDPVATPAAAQLFGAGRVRATDDLDSALEGAEVVILITRWPEYASLPARLAAIPSPPLCVDGRRMLAPEGVARYAGIGRT